MPKSDGVQLMEPINGKKFEPFLSSIMTVNEFLKISLGISSTNSLTEIGWLNFSDQGLIEI